MSIFSKAASSSSPFKSDRTTNVFASKTPFASSQKPSGAGTSSVFSKSPSGNIFSSASKPGFGKSPDSSKEKGVFQTKTGFGHSSSFKPTSPFEAFTKPESQKRTQQQEPKTATMKPLSPDEVRGVRTNMEIVKQIEKDNRSHVPVVGGFDYQNNDTVKVLLKRIQNLYGVEPEEGKESPYIRHNNGAYLSDGTLVNSVLRDWLKGFERTHKLQKFTTLRHFDRYLFAEDFLIPNRDSLLKAIQLKNELGSDEAARALQSQLYDQHTEPFHQFLVLELRAIHEALFVLRSERSVIAHFKFEDYMRFARESVNNLKASVMESHGQERTVEYQLHQLIQAIQLNHWMMEREKTLPKGSFSIEELIGYLQFAYYLNQGKCERSVQTQYYWAVIQALQVLRYTPPDRIRDSIIDHLNRVREDESTGQPTAKTFLQSVVQLALDKTSPPPSECWTEVQGMVRHLYEEQSEGSGFIDTLVHWLKVFDKTIALSYLCHQQEQNEFLRFVCYLSSLFPDVTERLEGLRVTEDVLLHFPVNFQEAFYFLSLMADYSFERGADPTPESATRVHKLFLKLQNLKLLHIHMNEDKFKEAFGEPGLRMLQRGESSLVLLKNMVFSQIVVEQDTPAVLESAGHDSIYVLFEKQYSAWRVLLQMGNAWCKKLNNPVVEKAIISEDTKLVGVLFTAIAGLITHNNQIIDLLCQEIRILQFDQDYNELDLAILFKYLMRVAYSGCEYLPEESEVVVAAVLSIVLQMLKFAPAETMGLVYEQLADGNLNLIHLICNANLHKEHQHYPTQQILLITEELLSPRHCSLALCDTRYGEVLLWFLEAGLMRIVCSIQTARFDSLEHYFIIYSLCLTLLGRIADLCCINPIRYPLALQGESSEISSVGSSLASNLCQVLHLIPVVEFMQSALDHIPLNLKFSSEKFQPKIWGSISSFRMQTPLWHSKLAEAQNQALFALNRLFDLAISALILQYPKHQDISTKMKKYLHAVGQDVSLYTGVPCLESSFMGELLKAVRLIRPRSPHSSNNEQPLLPLPLNVIQLIGSSYKLNHPHTSQPICEEIERESVLALSKILIIWELTCEEATYSLTALYPGSLSQSSEEAKALVKKLTLIPQSPFSFLNTVQAAVETLNIAALSQPEFTKLILNEGTFLELLLQSAVKEAAPIQHSYTCFSLLSVLLTSEVEVTATGGRTQSMRKFVTSVCQKISFFQKLVTHLSLKYSQVISENDFVSELDRLSSRQAHSSQLLLNQENFSKLAKLKIIQTIIFELLKYALNQNLIKSDHVASALQKAPLAADLQTSYFELSNSIQTANYILKNFNLLTECPNISRFESAVKSKLSDLAYQVYLQVNINKTAADVGEVLNAVSYPLFYSDSVSQFAVNLFKFQAFESIPFKYGHNFLYDESEVLAQFAGNIGRSPRELEKATILIQAVNYVMSLISLQGTVLSKFHDLARVAFRLVPEKETQAFSRLNQPSSYEFSLLTNLVRANREARTEESHHEIRYSMLFKKEHLTYFESLLQGSWGSMCEEIKVPHLSRLYCFAMRAKHTVWLVDKNSQHIQLDRNRYWRKSYKRFCEDHKSPETLAKSIRSFLGLFQDSIWIPLNQLHREFKEQRDSPQLSQFLANIVSDLLSSLFRASSFHSLYELVVLDKGIFDQLSDLVYGYFHEFRYFYEASLKLARNTIMLFSVERSELLPHVKQLFSTSIFKFLNFSKEGRPSELDQLQDELKLLLLYYQEIGKNAELCFANDVLDLVLSSQFVSLLEGASPFSEQSGCLLLAFEVMGSIFTQSPHASSLEREVIALITTYHSHLLDILNLFNKLKFNSQDLYSKAFTLKNLHTTLRLVTALQAILSSNKGAGHRFQSSQLQSRITRPLCDSLILGCLSLFSTQVSLEKTYSPQNSLEEELIKKKFKKEKRTNQNLIKLRDFTSGGVEFTHLQNYNPNLFVLTAERLLQLIGVGLCELLSTLLSHSSENSTKAFSYFGSLWTRDDLGERGHFGMVALDRLEDLVMFLKYLVCKSLAWDLEVRDALEELRAVAIVDEEVEGYNSEAIEILKTTDCKWMPHLVSFKVQNVSGGLASAISLLKTVLKTGREYYTSSFGVNKHIDEAFNSTDQNVKKSEELLKFIKR